MKKALAPVAKPADDLQSAVDALAPWFQNIDLGDVQTAPDHFLGDYPAFKFARFADALPKDLAGKSVLDIGCNAGFYSFEMKRRGAAEVLGIDTDPRYLAQAELVADTLGYGDVTFRNLSVYDVARIGRRFDLVIFMGVFYHLRHPLLALDLIRDHVADDMLLFQTMQRGSDDAIEVPEDHPFHVPGTTEPPAYFDEPGYPKMHFIERHYAGDWTNWWAPNRACSKAMLRAAGFAVEAQPEAEVYLCRVTERPFAGWGPGDGAVYPATGMEDAR
ncbi:MAG: TIGR04290 family methyltransferase [Sphingobium sp.]